MTNQEKMHLIEEVLRIKANTLTEETELSSLRQWDSLNILNLQIRLTAINPDLQFSDLFACETVSALCELF